MANADKRAAAHAGRFVTPGNPNTGLTRHSKRIEELVRSNGWPTPAMVGEKACRDALLLVMRSGDEDFQRECLELVKRAYKEDKSPITKECLNKLTMHLHG